jgi:hypothetical protein
MTMDNLQTLVQWFTANPFSGAAFVFGGAVVIVTVYTYLYDYEMLPDRG